MEQQTFPEQAGVRYAVIGKGKRVHYSPNDDGLCGRAITSYLDAAEAVALFDKGYELCASCHRAAERRAEARRLAAASPLAAAATKLAEIVERVDAERAEQRIVEGVVVEHVGTAEGSEPRHATHPDVAAARLALTGLTPARLTDGIDMSRYADEFDTSVRGYMLEPRGEGRVAAYWIEAGCYTAPDGEPHRAELKILRDRFKRAGWRVERGLLCSFAHLPASAPQKPAAAVEPTAPECLHHTAVRPDVSGDPITACARKQPNQEAGVFSDEGCVEGDDCAVEAANRAAELNAEEDSPADDPLYVWDLLCVEHRGSEQPADTCEECDAEEIDVDAADDLAARLAAIPDAEHTEGTWRDGWIKADHTDETLFVLDSDDEQGALFT
ncbi:hypothetical protein AB0A77_34070 [Streptomyces varsoviensis]|uniref:hypothetical protein n=1 Tax=Streptomyces varsoviensis TaxID=67373 RepID=UPI0033E75D43